MFTARGRRSPLELPSVVVPGASSVLLGRAQHRSPEPLLLRQSPGLGRRVSGALVVSLVSFLTPALGSPLHRSLGHGSEADHDQCCRLIHAPGPRCGVQATEDQWPAPGPAQLVTAFPAPAHWPVLCSCLPASASAWTP